MLFLSKNNLFYTRLIAICWKYNLLSPPSIVSSRAGSKVSEFCLINNDELPVFINCKGTTSCHDHAFEQLRAILSELNFPIIFIIADLGGEGLEKDIRDELGKPIQSIRVSSTVTCVVYGSSVEEDFVLEHLGKIPLLEVSFAENAVKKCYRNFDEPCRLESTPLIATGAVNSRNIISDYWLFLWISILLNDKFHDLCFENRLSSINLLAVSLRACPFVGALRLLSNKSYISKIEMIDHLGPKHKVFEEYDLTNSNKGNYILIADFVIGGTELRSTSAYLKAKGASLKGVVTIGSYLDNAKQYGIDIDIRRLVSIYKCCPKLKYEFTPTIS